MFISEILKTGKINLLKTLGGLLSRKCYGIQRTASTPRDSLHSTARYSCLW